MPYWQAVCFLTAVLDVANGLLCAGACFVELAISFVIQTASALPIFLCGQGWVFPLFADECTVHEASAARVVASMIRVCLRTGQVPQQVSCCRVPTLESLGYKGNRACSAGLTVRPLLAPRVAEVLRVVFHQDAAQTACLRRSKCSLERLLCR